MMDVIYIHMLRPGIRRSGGPLPKFTDYHIWKAIMTLDPTKPVGRKSLSCSLNIGEGSTRTILSVFSEQGLIAIGRNGITLTDEGVETKRDLQLDIAATDVAGLTIGQVDCVVRVPRSAKKVMFGCEERDIAIKAGAIGATTLVCMNNCLIFPGSDYPVDPDVEDMLRKKFKIKNEDVFIIGTAHDYEAAEVGAVTAALNITGGIRISREIQDILGPRSTPSELISLAFAIHDLVGGLPVCAKSRDNLGIRIENGAVIDNAYTGEILEEVIEIGTTIRRMAPSGPYKGIRVIVTPIDLDSRTIAAIGVVDIRSMAGMDNLIRRYEDE